MKEANAAIRNLTSDDVARYEADGSLTLELEGGPLTFEAGDFEVVSEGVEGRAVRQETATDASGATRTVTVALDTTLTDALRARRLRPRVRQPRSELAQRGRLRGRGPDRPRDRCARTVAGPSSRTPASRRPSPPRRLATSLVLEDEPSGDLVQDVEIGGETLTVGVRRV